MIHEPVEFLLKEFRQQDYSQNCQQEDIGIGTGKIKCPAQGRISLRYDYPVIITIEVKNPFVVIGILIHRILYLFSCF